MRTVGIYIYDNAEVLDFSGPFEVFSTASRISSADQPPFNVLLIAEHQGAVKARGGYTVMADFSIDNHPPLDLLIVVGGVHIEEMTKASVICWINRTSRTCELVASVCTGAFLLAEAGVLENCRVVTHWEDISDLRYRYPQLEVVDDKRWVDCGNRVTSAGISAGIDMSLHLVSRLEGPTLALNIARQMAYGWTVDNV